MIYCTLLSMLQVYNYQPHINHKTITCISSPDLAHADHPDEKSIMTYVAALYEIFPKEPTVQETLYDNVSTVYCTLYGTCSMVVCSICFALK